MKSIRTWPTRLFSYYRAYHQPSPLLLRYISVFGLVGYPLLYLLRYVRAGSGYDDFGLRLLVVMLLLMMLVRERWPLRLKPFYLHFSYFVITFALPFMFVFTSLKNGGGPAAVGNTFMAVFLLMLLADWRNLIVMLTGGFTLAALAYAATEAAPRFPMEYVARLPVLLVGVIGGSVFKFALEEAAAERVRQAYASLAGSIAHEMRNPMAQVRHSLEAIRHALPLPSLRAKTLLVEGRTVDQLYRHVAQGEMAVKRGLQVIAMTLDEVNAKPLDASRLVGLSAADVCTKAMEEYGYENEHERLSVALSVQEDFIFRGDETAFLFVLFNLLKNALYYLAAQPAARIDIVVTKGRIAVRDTGPGIAPEVLARLFQPFRTSGKAGGTGLGLAYCRRVVQAFGGTIACESVPGSHTEFSMTFPVVTGPELEAGHAAERARARRLFADRRVLVVDDDAGIRAATRHKLLELYCVVREASDGLEALQALQEGPYDLVLVDLNMPRMDGYALADALRSGRVPANRETCLVAHTSEPPHIARVKTQSAGFDGFAAKPCDQAMLLRVLCEAMEARERSRGRGRGWLNGRRFLLADDNAYNRAAVGGYLKHAGADVVEVGSGDAALRELAGVELFDAVLLDIHMPGLDGVETARALRAADIAQSSVPIIAISAHVDPPLVAAAREAGIGEFLLKPVEAPLLYEKLAMLMGVEAPARTPQAAPPPLPPDALLDENRLLGYQRIGMLDELVEEFLPEIDRLVERLQAAVEINDLQGTVDALHSLLGMSGEAGAQALYRHVRAIYIPMLEQRSWPSVPGWVARTRELATQTGQALREWAVRSGADA